MRFFYPLTLDALVQHMVNIEQTSVTLSIRQIQQLAHDLLGDKISPRTIFRQLKQLSENQLIDIEHNHRTTKTGNRGRPPNTYHLTQAFFDELEKKYFDMEESLKCLSAIIYQQLPV